MFAFHAALAFSSDTNDNECKTLPLTPQAEADEQVLCYLSCKNPGLIPSFDTGTVCVCRGIWSRVVCLLCVCEPPSHLQATEKKTEEDKHCVPPYGPRDTFNSALILMSDDTGSPGGQSERREAPVWKEKAWIMAPMD